MISQQRLLVALALVPISVVAVSGQYKCVAIANPPKLPLTRASGRVSSGNLLRVLELAGVADNFQPTRCETGSVQIGTMVEVLEDLIVVEAPDIEPDGACCGGDRCSAKVTKMGSQMWWFHIKLPNGKTGWT